MNKWNNKFCYQVASCWLFILSYTTMHGSMNIIFIYSLLRTLSVSQRVWLLIVGIYMNTYLEGIWLELVMARISTFSALTWST